jgi:hypothetical protein
MRAPGQGFFELDRHHTKKRPTMFDSYTTMFVFIGAVVASMLIRHNALNRLTPEQKLALMETTPKVPWPPIFIAVAFALKFWLTARFGHSGTFLGGFMIVLIVGLLLSCVLMLPQVSETRSSDELHPHVHDRPAVSSLWRWVRCFGGSYSSIRDIDAADQKLMEEIARTKEWRRLSRHSEVRNHGIR